MIMKEKQNPACQSGSIEKIVTFKQNLVFI